MTKFKLIFVFEVICQTSSNNCIHFDLKKQFLCRVPSRNAGPLDVKSMNTKNSPSLANFRNSQVTFHC